VSPIEVIRPARVEEVPEILRLWRDAETVVSTGEDADTVRGLIERGEESLLVAEIDGRLAGTVVATWDGWRGNFYRLAVVPEFRRIGLALRLVREGERRLRAQGAVRVSALVLHDEAHAVAFWQAAGYRHDERIHRFFRMLGEPDGD
jgi:ribosomal protein S18 acetylase RimI-like enzyme